MGRVVISAFGTAMTAALIGFGMFLRARRQLLATLRERAETAEAEQRRSAEAARQGERTRIAREMHDVLAHRISLVSMHAGALEYRVDASPEEVATAAGVIRSNAHQALVDLREVIGVLRGGDAGGDGTPDGTSTSRPQPTLTRSTPCSRRPARPGWPCAPRSTWRRTRCPPPRAAPPTA